MKQVFNYKIENSSSVVQLSVNRWRELEVVDGWHLIKGLFGS